MEIPGIWREAWTSREVLVRFETHRQDLKLFGWINHVRKVRNFFFFLVSIYLDRVREFWKSSPSWSSYWRFSWSLFINVDDMTIPQKSLFLQLLDDKCNVLILDNTWDHRGWDSERPFPSCTDVGSIIAPWRSSPLTDSTNPSYLNLSVLLSDLWQWSCRPYWYQSAATMLFLSTVSAIFLK